MQRDVNKIKGNAHVATIIRELFSIIYTQFYLSYMLFQAHDTNREKMLFIDQIIVGKNLWGKMKLMSTCKDTGRVIKNITKYLNVVSRHNTDTLKFLSYFH